MIYLYPPSGPAVIQTSSDRTEHQLNAAGTWTIVVEDLGQDHTGSYNVSLLNVTSGPLTNGADPDGGFMVSAELRTGQANQAADFDAIRFQGTAGDRVVAAALATAGASYNTSLTLYPPGGGAAETATGGGDRLDAQLAATGLYTLVVEDVSLNDAGAWSVTLLNLTRGPWVSVADRDGAHLIGGESIAATISPAPDLDAYKFTGAAGDTAHITAVATSGPINTMIYIYPPSGPPIVATTSDVVNHVLTVSGQHTILIEDSGLNEAGGYLLTYEGPGDPAGAPSVEEAFDRTRVVLRSPYPNPFTRTATVAFSIPAERSVRLRVFDASGALVRTLADAALAAGRHQFEWDGRNDHGRFAASGVYYLELQTGAETTRRQLVRVR